MTQCRGVEVAFVPHMVNHREMMRLRVDYCRGDLRRWIGRRTRHWRCRPCVDPRECLLLSDQSGSVFRSFVERSASRGRVAEALKLTAQDLLKLDVVDEIVPEPEGGAHCDYDTAATNLGAALRQNLERGMNTPVEELLKKRYKKFRALGNFAEGKATSTAARS